MGVIAKPTDFSDEDYKVLLWLAANCPDVTSQWAMLCDGLRVKHSGDVFLSNPEHRLYAREHFRRMPDKPSIMVKHDPSYDPFDYYLCKKPVAENIITNAMSTTSKSSATKKAKTPTKTERKSPMKPRGGAFNLGEMQKELEEAATTIRKVGPNDYDAKFVLLEGMSCIHGSMAESIYEKKANKDASIMYLVNKTKLQVPANCATESWRRLVSAELVEYTKTATAGPQPAFLITYPIDANTYFDDQKEVESKIEIIWGTESEGLANKSKTVALKAKRENMEFVRYLYTIPPHGKKVEKFTNEEFNNNFNTKTKLFDRAPPNLGFLLPVPVLVGTRGYITLITPVAGSAEEIKELEDYESDDDMAEGLAAFMDAESSKMDEDPQVN